MKQCFKCGKIKARGDFYKHSRMTDGLLGKCKDCTKIDSLKNRNDKIEYYRKYDRGRGLLPHRRKAADEYAIQNRTQATKSKLKWSRNNREKVNAQQKARRAVMSGKLKKLPCERCGSRYVHGHHEDHSKPIDVIWLCPKHHSERHREINEARRLTSSNKNQ